MTRPIKFRAWIKPRNQMLDVLCVCRDGNITAVTIETSDGVTPYEDLQGFMAGNIQLMQFTGLLDKNGKEIYEGDICKYGEMIMPVVWREEWGGFAMHGKFKGNDIWYYVGAVESTAIIPEVIGNVYENPGVLHQ